MYLHCITLHCIALHCITLHYIEVITGKRRGSGKRRLELEAVHYDCTATTERNETKQRVQEQQQEQELA
jgi:hypothetical protein